MNYTYMYFKNKSLPSLFYVQKTKGLEMLHDLYGGKGLNLIDVQRTWSTFRWRISAIFKELVRVVILILQGNLYFFTRRCYTRCCWKRLPNLQSNCTSKKKKICLPRIRRLFCRYLITLSGKFELQVHTKRLISFQQFNLSKSMD